jgi:hypothetical protein
LLSFSYNTCGSNDIGMTKHFMFHIHWISILKFLYFNFFSDSSYITFLSDGIIIIIIIIIIYYYLHIYYVYIYLLVLTL